uniref:Uncharacterized protein n=1 Tax=Clytia hemisphaerica TaxID=252671 RepID=A0A7M5WLL5_9CNID
MPTSTGKRYFNEVSNSTNRDVKTSKILKLDETKLVVSVPSENEKSSDKSTSTCIVNEGVEETNISKLDISDSCQNGPKKSRKFTNVLRSERPLKSMGMYTKYELHGIVPENVVDALKKEKNQKYRQLKRGTKNSKDPSNIDTNLLSMQQVFQRNGGKLLSGKWYRSFKTSRKWKRKDVS